jgi:3',5'-cyclic AMP phosphodiesterase CpdA
MLIAQISDLHLAPPGEKTLGRVPMDENLKAVVAHINAQTPRPDVVIVSGDITDQGDLASAQYARSLLDVLAMPYYVVPGNHDARATLLEAFAPEHCRADLPGFITYAVEAHDIRLIALDSSIAHAPGGELCPARLDWLARTLAEQPDKPSLIFLHHPPLKCGVLESDADGFIGAEAFARLVRRHENILRITCGHIHLITCAGWSGTSLSTCPSIGMRLRLDLTQTKESAFLADAPAYQLHLYTYEGNLITHTQALDEPGGPYPFEPLKT